MGAGGGLRIFSRGERTVRGLYRWIFENEKLDWNKEILKTQTGSYSLSDIQKSIESYTALLRQVGDIYGKKVALLVPNVFSFLSLLLAVNRLGATVVPINPFLEKEELESVLSFVDPHIIFTIQKYDSRKCFKVVYEWAHSIREETVIFETEDYWHWSTLVIKGSPKAVGEYDADIIDCAYDDEGVLKTTMMNIALIKHMDQSLSTVMALSKDDKVFGMAPMMSGLGACLLLTLIKKQLQFVVVESRNWQELISFIKKNPCNKLLTTIPLFNKLKMFAKRDQNLDLEKLEFIG